MLANEFVALLASLFLVQRALPSIATRLVKSPPPKMAKLNRLPEIPLSSVARPADSCSGQS